MQAITNKNALYVLIITDERTNETNRLPGIGSSAKGEENETSKYTSKTPSKMFQFMKTKSKNL